MNPENSNNDKKYLEVFNAIVSFVNDLWEVFGNPKKITPLALYHRLVQNIKVSDNVSISKAVFGFKTFMKTNEIHIMKNVKNIPRGTVIRYGESQKVYIDIQKFIYQKRNDEETVDIIRSHLLTIGMIIDPNPEKLEQLEKAQEKRENNPLGIDISTPEGEFVNELMETARNGLAEGDVGTKNPMEAMMKLYQSGVVQKMAAGMQGGGGMNMKKLMKTMRTAMDHLIPMDDSDEEEGEAKEEVSQSNVIIPDVD